MRSAKQGNYLKGLINFHHSVSLEDPAVWFEAFRKKKHWELGNAYPLSGVRPLSGRVFDSCAKKSSLSLLANRSYESGSRILCSERRTRVKFINKIDSEVAWMTRVLGKNFLPCCLTVDTFYVLVNVLNRGAHYLT